MAVRGPELELRVAGCAQPREVVVAARIEIDAGQRLGVAAVETLRQPDHRRQGADGAPQRAGQLAVTIVGFLWRRLTVIPRQQRHYLDLLR